jgi:hypothetical protein
VLGEDGDDGDDVARRGAGNDTPGGHHFRGEGRAWPENPLRGRRKLRQID